MDHLVKVTAATCLTVFGTVGLSAADVLAVAARTAPINGTNTAFVAVPLKDDNSTTVTFTTTKATERVVFTYNAECSGINAEGWVSVKIIVDGNKATAPDSGGNFAFCHSGVEAGAVRQSYISVSPAGSHTVSVRAAAQGGSTAWTLDDSSLVVEN